MAKCEVSGLQKPLGVQHKVRSSALYILDWIFGEKKTKMGFFGEIQTNKDRQRLKTSSNLYVVRLVNV